MKFGLHLGREIMKSFRCFSGGGYCDYRRAGARHRELPPSEKIMMKKVLAMTITQSQTGLFFSRPDTIKLYYKYNQMGQAKLSTFTNNSEKDSDGWLLSIRVGSSRVSVCTSPQSIRLQYPTPTEVQNGNAHAACWGTEELKMRHASSHL